MVHRFLLTLGLSAGLALGAAVAPVAAFAATYSAPLNRAIADLSVRAEVRTGYSRELFPHWIDADGDGCSTRDEVLIAEADDPVTVKAGCALSGGRWFSYYDRVSGPTPVASTSTTWSRSRRPGDSGARNWARRTRQAFANDLGDERSLVGVTDSVNQSKSDRDPGEWMPEHATCRYVREWVAVKHRWRLNVNRAERNALVSFASHCANRTITVTLAR